MYILPQTSSVSTGLELASCQGNTIVLEAYTRLRAQSDSIRALRHGLQILENGLRQGCPKMFENMKVVKVNDVDVSSMHHEQASILYRTPQPTAQINID